MNAKQINKTIGKAFDYSGDIMKEMMETYREQEQPYFLHIMLLQCCYGLRHYGFETSDIFELINEEMKSK